MIETITIEFSDDVDEEFRREIIAELKERLSKVVGVERVYQEHFGKATIEVKVP